MRVSRITKLQIAKLLNEFRGVSSTAKLPVSKTGLGGSNPSAPARVLGLEDAAGATGREKSKMATMTEPNQLMTSVKSWPERVKTFYNDVRTEMRKVTAPSYKDVRATTIVVIITVFLFGVYFWIIDNTIGSAINYLFKYLTHR